MTWKEDLIKYRREKAREAIEDARILFERERLFSSVNRIYYALFYQVTALLKTKDLSSPKHTEISLPPEALFQLLGLSDQMYGDQLPARVENPLFIAHPTGLKPFVRTLTRTIWTF